MRYFKRYIQLIFQKINTVNIYSEFSILGSILVILDSASSGTIKESVDIIKKNMWDTYEATKSEPKSMVELRIKGLQMSDSRKLDKVEIEKTVAYCSQTFYKIFIAVEQVDLDMFNANIAKLKRDKTLGIIEEKTYNYIVKIIGLGKG